MRKFEGLWDFYYYFAVHNRYYVLLLLCTDREVGGTCSSIGGTILYYHVADEQIMLGDRLVQFVAYLQLVVLQSDDNHF